MDRLTRLARWLTLVASAAGVVCFHLVYRPTGVADWLAVAHDFAFQAFVNPAVPVAALVAVVATVAARLLERPGRARPAGAGSARGPAVHRVGAGSSSPTDPTQAPRRTNQRQRRRDAGRRESRLAAHLEGDGDVVAFVDELLALAAAAGASDVHLQPLEHTTRVTFRVGGELEEVAAVPRHHHAAVVRRLKVLARLIPYQTDRPQDGHIALDTASGGVDLRISVLPTNHGEKVVLRLARAADELLDLSRLGMPGDLRARFEELLAEPQGILALTGPTGSGKTTSLYASLARIHATRGETANIATLEDPIEIDLPFLSQTERAAGLPFHEGLRSVLRQDPDVLMIGEVRDRETCQTAVQAGMTGHLILTTLHAESAAGVFNRLIDLGVEPFLVASAVLATLSQRLARRLCSECRRPAPLPRASARRLVEKGIACDGLTFSTADGCDACDGNGLRGRLALFELLRITPSLRQLITKKATTDRIAEQAVREGMTPLFEVAVAAAAAGRISLDEALRVAA